MNRKELKKSVFTFTIFGKLLTAIELSVIMIVLGATMSVVILWLTPSITAKFAITIFVSSVAGILGFFIGYNMPFPLFIWKIFPMNKKAAIQYLKDQKTKAEAKLSGSDDCLKQMHQDYQDLIIEHAQEMEDAKEEIKEIEKLLTEI